MGEEGILMCFAFFSNTKVGMHRTSGSFTSQIAMRYRTSRTLTILLLHYVCLFELILAVSTSVYVSSSRSVSTVTCCCR